MSDLISRADAIEAVRMSEHRITIADEQGGFGTVKWDMWGVYTAEAVEAIKALPSAEAVPQSDQYKKGFEDAKRAFELEYARESENMRKRNAQLEVMLNAQKAISADAVQGDWIFNAYEKTNKSWFECSVCGSDYFHKHNFCPNCGARMLREESEVEE